MTLVFVVWSGSLFGGMERRYIRLAEAIAHHNYGCKVYILAQKRCVATLYDFLPANPSVHIVEFGSDKYSRSLKGLISELNSFRQSLFYIKPNHVHLVCNPGILATILSVIVPRGSSLSLSMVDSTYDKTSNMVQRFIGRLGLWRFKSVDCLSKGTFDIFLRFFGQKLSAKARIAPCSFSDYSKEIESTVRDIDVLCMARFVEDKGYDLVEGIATHLHDLNVHLCGFGPRPFSADCHPFQVYKTSNPISVLSRAKIFLSIQRGTNYPSQATLEAMYSGCAIVATDVGETRSFLDESCAIMIPYDAVSLRVAIEELLSNPQKRTDLGEEAKKRAVSLHTIERYRDYFVERIVDSDTADHNRHK